MLITFQIILILFMFYGLTGTVTVTNNREKSDLIIVFVVSIFAYLITVLM